MASLDAPALFNLFSTGQYSDFTIICKDRQFKVHKMLICPNSDFFRATAKGNFQEQDSVTLHESDPDIVAKVLHYLHFASYHSEDEACTQAHHLMLRHATLFDDTDQGQWFRALKSKNKSAKNAVLTQILTHFRVYEAANMLGVEKLMRAATFHILETAQTASTAGDLAVILETIYSTLPQTDTILRPAMSHSCAVNYDRLCNETEVDAVMKQHEPAIWTAAGVLARVHNTRMRHFGEEIVRKVCCERRCGCEGNGLSLLDVYIPGSGEAKIELECDRCEDSVYLDIDDA